jgi:CHAD domain-containing protein
MSTVTPPAPTPVKPAARKTHGLAFWMQHVLEECDRASIALASDPVHDLRVALRRCRSMADGLMAIDPDPSWKQMKKGGKPLFSKLGELRDVQVMEEWVNRLMGADDPVSSALLSYLAAREAQCKQGGAQALREFDRKQWTKWSVSLPRRAARIRTGSLIFRHLALERWTEGWQLHRRALRSPSRVAWHSLRIGLKRFRYIVENFLPEHHESWIKDLKELQDLLGEIHDFDVLWNTALEIRAFPDADARSRWHTKIQEERNRRIQQYRDKMVGKGSLWHVWRAELPSGKQVESAALARLKLWASILDPDFKHSGHVARLALQLYDGFTNGHANPGRERERSILQVAALLHDVGLAKKEKGHHKATYRMVEKMSPPLGWTREELLLAAAVARYHRGALPHAGQKTLAHVPASERAVAVKLAAILRLANAFDADRTGRIHRLEASAQNGKLFIAAEGYNPRDRMAESIAAGRHLLELVSRRPIIVKRLNPHLKRATA